MGRDEKSDTKVIYPNILLPGVLQQVVSQK